MRKILSLLVASGICLSVSAQTFNDIAQKKDDKGFLFSIPIKAKCNMQVNISPLANKYNVATCSKECFSSNKGVNKALKGSNHRLLYNSKLRLGFLFSETYDDMSLGAKIYKISGEDFKELCDLPFAAYTSENGERMNYNNILPYISVIRSGERILMFFNTPIVVKNPNQSDEEILESKDFYFELSDKGFIMKKY